jgi:hypothetical protein
MKDRGIYTLAELRAVARTIGCTHVGTMAGAVPLADWTPYGYGGVNGEASGTLRFALLEIDPARPRLRAVDGAGATSGRNVGAFLNGAWTFGAIPQRHETDEDCDPWLSRDVEGGLRACSACGRVEGERCPDCGGRLHHGALCAAREQG